MPSNKKTRRRKMKLQISEKKYKQLITQRRGRKKMSLKDKKLLDDSLYVKYCTCLKKFEFSKDEFYQMFKKQIKYNMRHTLNFNSIKLTKKKYNDFED